MPVRTGIASVLLFSSGFCALLYQTTWLREFRLIFGGSTAATAAVLAIFMGGLGLGGAILGRRADRSTNPLALYGKLEVGIAVTAALSPFLLVLARSVYIWSGGSVAFGPLLASGIRLLLAILVIGLPTVLMGGTLPAAARAVETSEDRGRRRFAVLYGFNTLGAVTGAVAATFGMLEHLGNRKTLWTAAAINVVVALAALAIARGWSEERDGTPEQPAAVSEQARISRTRFGFVLGAAAVVGAAFFLMEMVWYRMLSPLLGGTTYTFGLILAVALAGIGGGGLMYSLARAGQPATLRAFSASCAIEALVIALPFALGDRVAILTILLRRLGDVGFEGFVGGWTLVTALVVLPGAMVAGFQFPLLIGLLGEGRRGVGRDSGLAYAWNTLGAIAGSLAGGFGILPFLGALGTWKLVVAMLVGLSVLAMLLGAFEERSRFSIAIPVLLSAAALACLSTLGPTAAWRHSPIGAGRADEADERGGFERWIREQRATVSWEIDGRESTVALARDAGYAFLVNGKSDGHVRSDAGTQVMSGLIGTVLHPSPRRAFVIGLGTGSTAGWMGRVPALERVDVAELEPGILHVAEVSRPVNADPLGNPKVRIHIGDAREVLLTARERYDLIFSEPSNPYRAGVASLFTRDFYEAVASRLDPEDGVFVQWVQTYEIEPRTIRSVYATLLAVFPHVESWQSQPSDLILIASKSPRRHDGERIRRALAEEPYRTAMNRAWRAESLEGFLARYVASSEFAPVIGDSAIGPVLNTDDRNVIEFEAARSVGESSEVDIAEIRSAAEAVGAHRPPITGEVDWERVERERIAMNTTHEHDEDVRFDAPVDLRSRGEAHAAWRTGRLTATLEWWKAQSGVPESSIELAMLAEASGEENDPDAELWIQLLRESNPIEADVAMARLRWRQDRVPEAAAALSKAFVGYRSDPWPHWPMMQRALGLAELMATDDPSVAETLYDALAEPFSAFMLDESRRHTALTIAQRIPGERCSPRTIRMLETFEPWSPWDSASLNTRVLCYEQTRHRHRSRARAEYDRFLSARPERLMP